MLIDLWPALLALTLLTLAPGADTLLVVRNTHRGGLADGTLTSLGICSGLFVHALLSAAGVSVLLLQSAWAFSVLKILGAVYLCWLGAITLYQAWRGFGANAEIKPSSYRFAPLRSFREGLLSNVLNPKTVLFYFAFLPQFIDPQHSAVVQSITLAALHFLIAMSWQSLLALMVNRVKQLVSHPLLAKVFHSLTGGFFISLGGALLFENQFEGQFENSLDENAQ